VRIAPVARSPVPGSPKMRISPPSRVSMPRPRYPHVVAESEAHVEARALARAALIRRDGGAHHDHVVGDRRQRVRARQ
jgi:hypothetical protein